MRESLATQVSANKTSAVPDIPAGGAEQARWRWSQVRECFRDPQYYFSLLFNFLIMIPNGALITFNTLIMTSFHFNAFDSILYYMPSQAVS